MKKLSQFAADLGATAKSAVKIMLQSRCVSIGHMHRDRALVVLGNGPSLRGTIETQAGSLAKCDLMAVNFAAIDPSFAVLRPRWYVLADPLFFGDAQTENLARLHKAFDSVDWPMTLVVPAMRKKQAVKRFGHNSNIKVQTVNAVGAEGFAWFEHLVYGMRLAMPRPRNVLIVAIMTGIAARYKEIYVAGADHSWMQTLDVDGDNRVVSVQPHFYADGKAEQKRVDTEYAGYRLHDIVFSFYVAFRAYHRIARFAGRCRVAVYNATPHSFIDAFARRGLPR